MNRRKFIKAGLAGTAVLAVGGAWLAWRELREADEDGVRRDPIGTVVTAVAPALLGDMLSRDAHRPARLARVVDGVHQIIAAFPAATRHEISELFGILDTGLPRRMLTGIGVDWPHAADADIAVFLDRWRHSRIALLQSGYFALHDLVLGAWYADPANWDAIGYAGPPNVE